MQHTDLTSNVLVEGAGQRMLWDMYTRVRTQRTLLWAEGGRAPLSQSLLLPGSYRLRSSRDDSSWPGGVGSSCGKGPILGSREMLVL